MNNKPKNNTTTNISFKNNVSNNSLVSGNTSIKNNVSGNTPVSGNKVSNTVSVKNNVSGNSSVSGNTVSVKNNVSGNTPVSGNKVSNTVSVKNNVSGNSSVSGNVSGNKVSNNTSVSGKNNKSSFKNTVTQQEQSILDKLNSIINDTDKTSFINNIMGSSNKSSSTSQKQEGRIGDNGENIVVDTDNYILILGIFLALVLLVLLYFLSKSFNVGHTLERLKMFERYQKITNFSNRKGGNTKVTLKDIVVSSSYNSCHNGNQMFGYTSENILKQILKSGCRYIELNVFASVYGDKAKPVVSQGYKQGQWKLMLNTTYFEDCINVIAKNAFSIISKEGGSPNPNDPLFLGLNLSTGYNLACLDLMHDIILDYLSDYLLDSKYSYQFDNYLHEIPVKNLQNKVIILASSGYEGSNLEELINCQWEDETNILDNPNIDLPANNTALENFVNLDDYKNAIDKDMKLEDRINKMKKKPFTFEDSVKYSDINKGKKSNKTKLAQFHKQIQEEFGDVLGEGKEKQKENMEDVNPLDVLSDGDNSINKTKLIRLSSHAINHPAFNASRVKQHNREGLTIVVPHVEGDFITRNYNPNLAFDLGCQFVAMNYQLVDDNMDKYITKFEKFGILEK